MGQVKAALQEGFQRNFVGSLAELVIGGGAAGVGKSRALLHTGFSLCHQVRDVPSIIFRRESKQITITGGLWDQAIEFAGQFPPYERPKNKISTHEFIFPNRSKLQFSHLSDAEKTHEAFQGAQFAFVGFDELTHFTEKQFLYLLGRNRSLSVRMPFMRATTNPQGDGWIKDLISWWLYPPDYKDESLADYPIWERAGVIRFFTKFEDKVLFGDSRDEVLALLPESAQKQYRRELIKSLTFIPGRLEENQILEKGNPNYRASLLALPLQERMQLLYGRWRTIENIDRILFERAVVEDFFTNDFVRPTGERYITADIALEGRDRFVIVVWDGWVIVDIIQIPKTDGALVVDKLKSVASHWKVPGRNICFDASGLGGYLRGFMRNSVPFFGGAAPMEEDYAQTYEQEGSEKPKYNNLRSQCYYVLARILGECESYCQYNVPQVVRDLKEELRATQKAETGVDKKRAVIPKDEVKAVLGRSPDIADAVSMRARFDLRPRVKKKPRTFTKLG